MTKNSRPGRGTMAGMIYDANESLNWILDDPSMKEAFRNSSIIGSSMVCSSDFHNTSSRPSTAMEKKKKFSEQESSSHSLSKLFNDDEERDLLGIGLFTIWEAGLLVSGYGGTGIVMSRNIVTGEWSSPVAVMVSGIGAGVLLGASIKTVVYLIYDYFTLKSISGTEGGVIFGAGAGATIGNWTTETASQMSYITSPKMMRTAGMTNNVALCKGLAGMYGAMSVEAGICKCRDKVNARFYGKEICGSDVLLSGEPMDIPNNTTIDGTGTSNYQAKRLLEKIHSKLERLCKKDGSDHGSSNKLSYNPSTTNNNSSDEINNKSSSSSNKPEDVRATLEELYADKSYDQDESAPAEQKEADKMKVETQPTEDSSQLAAPLPMETEAISAQ